MTTGKVFIAVNKIDEAPLVLSAARGSLAVANISPTVKNLPKMMDSVKSKMSKKATKKSLDNQKLGFKDWVNGVLWA